MGSEGSGGRGSPIPCHTLCRVTDDKPETDSPLFNFMYSTLATCRVQPAEGHLLCAPCVPSLGTGPVHPVCEPGFAGGCGVGTRVEGWRLSLRGHIVREESPPCHSSPPTQPHIQECRCGSVVWGPQHAPQRPGLLPTERVDRAP